MQAEYIANHGWTQSHVCCIVTTYYGILCITFPSQPGTQESIQRVLMNSPIRAPSQPSLSNVAARSALPTRLLTTVSNGKEPHLYKEQDHGLWPQSPTSEPLA